jgi:hypothetical protein
MTTPLDQVSCASVPGDALAVLAPLRCVPEVRVAVDGPRYWVFWPAGQEGVLECLLPAPGVTFYELRGASWYRPGSALPAFEVRDELTTHPLDRVLTPAPLQAEPPGPDVRQSVRLRLVRDERPRRATAMRCDLAVLGRWAETATTAALTAVVAARCDEQVLLLGDRLPALAGGERFWGRTILVPLGHRLEPDLPDGLVQEALGIGGDDVLLFGSGEPEVVPRAAFQGLSRAAVRLAMGRAV